MQTQDPTSENNLSGEDDTPSLEAIESIIQKAQNETGEAFMDRTNEDEEASFSSVMIEAVEVEDP
eukprot:316456-Ditylum_brightwellii.AAC.1